MPLGLVPSIWLGTGLVLLAYALWLIVVDFSSPLHRVFALHLTLVGTDFAFRWVDPTDPARQAWTAVTEHGLSAAPFALLYLAAVLARRAGARIPVRAALASAFAGAGLLLWSRMHDPSLWSDGTPGSRVELALVTLAPSLVAWALAVQARKAGPFGRRRALLMSSAGFLLFPLAFAAHYAIPGLMTTDPLADGGAALLPLAPGVAVAYHLARLGSDGDPRVARVARAALAMLALPLATVAALAVLHLGAGAWATHVAMVSLMVLWHTAGLGLIGYSILRGELFGLQTRIRWTLSRGAVAGVFVGAFFVASKLTESFVGQLFGARWVSGAVAAGLLLFAISPIQAAAERVARTAVPPFPAAASLDPPERRRLYRRYVLEASSDGDMNAKERRMLEIARSTLGLTVPEARTIEKDMLA